MSTTSKAKESIEACEDPDPEFRRIMCSIAMSGAVAAVALVDGADLYVASTGDCSVVLGSISENDTWIAKKLTTEHSTDNPKELKRIQDEHPSEKMRYVVHICRVISKRLHIEVNRHERGTLFKKPVNRGY